MENLNKDYMMSSLDEYFNLLEKENAKRSEMVAKFSNLWQIRRNSSCSSQLIDDIQQN